MASHRQDRFREELMRLGGLFLARQSNRRSLVTITNAFLSSDLKHATLYITVYPETDEQSTLSFLGRRQTDFRTFLKEHGAFGHLPFIRFEIDRGEKHRQHIDELMRT